MLGVEPIERIGAAPLDALDHRHVRRAYLRRAAAAREQHDARVGRRGRKLGRGEGIERLVRGDHIKPVPLDAQRPALVKLACGGQQLHVFVFLGRQIRLDVFAYILAAARKERGEHVIPAAVGLQREQPCEKLRAVPGGQPVLRGDVLAGETAEQRHGARRFFVGAEKADLLEKLRIGMQAVACRKTQRYGLHHGGAAVEIYVRDLLRASGLREIDAEIFPDAVRPQGLRQSRPAAEQNALGVDYNSGAVP